MMLWRFTQDAEGRNVWTGWLLVVPIGGLIVPGYFFLPLGYGSIFGANGDIRSRARRRCGAGWSWTVRRARLGAGRCSRWPRNSALLGRATAECVQPCVGQGRQIAFPPHELIDRPPPSVTHNRARAFHCRPPRPIHANKPAHRFSVDRFCSLNRKTRRSLTHGHARGRQHPEQGSE
jgi:hypothetical protein